MNWVNELLDLYEKNEDKAGKIDAVYVEGKDETKILTVLLPIYHTTFTAQITVTVNEKGDFMGAEKVPKNEAFTIIPVTEKSATRTNHPVANPLCDNLKYIAGDYDTYYKNVKKENSSLYKEYIKALKKWIKSEYTHKKAEAIYKYLSKGCLIEDLVKAEVIKLDENGRMTDKEKIQGISQADAFVRFKIISDEKLDINDINNTDGSLFEECWKDRSLQKSFIDYYSSASEEKDISYLTGNLDQISYLQPKKIRNEGDGGKLISSNDEVNFTYRGRFENKYQAFSIGYTDSQKMHNALKWIIRKQGFNYDSLTVVVWESSLSTLPSVIAGTNEICNEYEGWDDDENTSSYLGTYEEGAKRFDNAMCGYKNKLLDMDYSRTVLLAFDAATTGRVSMVEYKNLETSRYFENIQNWHNNCMWAHRGFNKQGKPCAYFGVPSPKEIAEALYGTEQNGRLSLGNRSKLGAEVFKRLLPCIIDKKRVPSDMVQAAIQKASSPVSYEKHYNWEKVLSVACSLIKKSRKEKYEEEWKVALDLECTNRDYLFGRLLAVADWAEYRTYDNDQSRETNAQRYMSAFSQRPLRTWKVIEGKVIPYLPKLKPWERKKYTKIIEEIYDKFTVDSFDSDESLGGLYLLGFHSQSLALKYSPNKEQENKEDNENE